MQGLAGAASPSDSRPDAPSEAQIRAAMDVVVRDSLRTLGGWTVFIVGGVTLGDAVLRPLGLTVATVEIESVFLAAILAVYVSLRKWRLPASWANAVVAATDSSATLLGPSPTATTMKTTSMPSRNTPFSAMMNATQSWRRGLP